MAAEASSVVSLPSALPGGANKVPMTTLIGTSAPHDEPTLIPKA
jgi:hypothetical protein